MPASPPNPSEENAYVIDIESAAELARLLHQDRHVTKSMGGLLAEQSDISNIHDVIDVACGPGGWALEVADRYPDIKVVGIDISKSMIEYARALAKAQKLKNVEFLVMDALKPLHSGLYASARVAGAPSRVPAGVPARRHHPLNRD